MQVSALKHPRRDPTHQVSRRHKRHRPDLAAGAMDTSVNSGSSAIS
jgi:hypothetical protein